MTDDLVSRIQALYEKAAKGPWSHDTYFIYAGGVRIGDFAGHSTPKFIVALVNDWPAIRERLERDGKDAEQLRKELAQCHLSR